MRFIPAAIIIALSITFTAFSGDSSASSALSDWELIQKNDPKTVTFSKTGERTYTLSTKYFDYSGTIKVTAVEIEESEFDTAFPYRATIEVELEKRLKNKDQEYGHGYYRWQSLGSLHFNHASGHWVTTAEYSKILQKTMLERQHQEEQKENSFANRMKPLYPLIVWCIVILLCMAFFNSLYQNVKLLRVYQKEIIAQLKMLNERMKKE
jgi:hypothetical protein